MQSLGFKQKASPEMRVEMDEHCMGHEMIMMDMMEKNPAFAQRVIAECPQFPMFMEMPIAPPAPQTQGVVADQDMMSGGPQAPTMSPEQQMAEQSALVESAYEPMAPETPEFGEMTPEFAGENTI